MAGIVAFKAEIASVTGRVDTQAERLNPKSQGGDIILSILVNSAIDQNELAHEKITVLLEGPA